MRKAGCVGLGVVTTPPGDHGSRAPLVLGRKGQKTRKKEKEQTEKKKKKAIKRREKLKEDAARPRPT